jgi:hypothetical protein
MSQGYYTNMVGYTRLMSDITKLDEMVVKDNKSNKGGRYEFL